MHTSFRCGNYPAKLGQGKSGSPRITIFYIRETFKGIITARAA